MVLVVAASSLSHSLDTLDEHTRNSVTGVVHAFPGLNLDPKQNNCVLDFLNCEPLKDRQVILWHDLINNSITSHPKKNNTPLTVDELVSTLQQLKNLYCVVTCQRDGAPYIFDILLNKLNCYVIDITKHLISATDKLDQSKLEKYSKLHQSPELELRSLGVVLHHSSNLQQIFKSRGTKRRSGAARRQAKKQQLEESAQQQESD